MLPYGIKSKIRLNLPDNHPPKGYINWWEDEISLASIDNGSKRQRLKRELNEELVYYLLE